MTTPKELIGAAREFHNDAVDWDQSLLGTQKLLLLTRHILATVRPDDGEPVTAEWLVELAGRHDDSDYWLSDDWYVARFAEAWGFYLMIGDNKYFEADEIRVLTVNTRGQLRAVCRALSFQLPEVPQ